MKFTYFAYENLINLIKRSGYCITDYNSYAGTDRPCILRHDVDMSLESAAKFAEFEANMKSGPVVSTYFVLISSDLYNPFSKENIQHLKIIMSAGHEIGLHFDEKKYMTEDDFDEEYLKDSVKKEAHVLSEIIERPVLSVSMHRPSKKFLEKDMTFDGLINSYSKKFFKQFKYMSDSRMNWRENAEEIVSSGKENALHILTHPIWYGENEKTIGGILKKFISSAVIERYRTVNDNLRNLEEIVKLEELQ